MKNRIVRAGLVFVSALFLFSVSGCKKDSSVRAKVIVYDVNGIPMQGTYVETGCPACDPTSPGNPIQNGLTDANGEVLFQFADGYKMVLEVTATKGALTGDGFLQLEEGQTVVEEIVIQ